MKKNIFIRLLAILVVAMMLVSAVSCTTEKSSETEADTNSETETEAPKTIEVPILAADVEFGKKITSDKITTKTISSKAVSETMVTSVDDVVGKYATVALYKGDFVYKGKLATKRPTNALDVSEIEKTRNKFIDVSQFITPNSGLDVYEALQKLIDNNTHRTIYFPDGEYLISKPLKTSAAAASSTSFYLADNAVIKASSDWKGGNDALIKMGGARSENDITTPGSNYYFIGGILDGNGKAKGLSLDSGRESLVSKVKIINATVGIHIPEGVNNKSSDMDIEDIDIIGCGGESKGIVAVGVDNNFTDIRISNVRVGVENGGGNFFRGVSVRLDKNPSYEGTIAFSTSGASWFYSCSSENMQTGFVTTGGNSSSAPLIKDFSIRWTEAKGDQIAFEGRDGFSAKCSNGIIDFFDETTNNMILKATGSKRGIFLDVIADTELCDEENYKTIFVSSKVGE